MSKIKPRFVRTISLRDFFLILLAWTIKKFLDFLWEKGKTRLKFEGESHIRRYLFVMFGLDLLMFMLGWVLYIPKDEKAIEYQELVRRFLRIHRRYHQYVGNEICCACLNVEIFKDHFEKYVSDLKLYPPFKF